MKKYFIIIFFLFFYFQKSLLAIDFGNYLAGESALINKDNKAAIHYFENAINLNKLDTKWVYNVNEWQQGRLTGYYWNRIFPEVSPLSSAFNIAFVSGTEGIGIQMGIDFDRLLMFDYDPLIVESLMNQWSRLIYNNIKKYQLIINAFYI